MTSNASSATTAGQVPVGVRRAHAMQFGTQITYGTYQFRLWAPGAKSVELALFVDAGEKRFPMQASDGGWFSVATSEARSGLEYQFVIDGDLRVPDPASRYQPEDVHGKSQLVDPASFKWTDGEWIGKPWDTAILYELNVGTFSEKGTFKGLEDKLDHLVSLGVTAVELMPLSDFPGRFGWGYDGVLPYAPESSYGTTDDLKSLVQTAHSKGLMVLLDVVYNHFGPEGNYLHAYAKKFFTEKHHTPWGAGINYDDIGCEVVRDFFIQNALYWINEYHFDGLRLDAVHAIKDDSKKHVLRELAEAIKAGPGATRYVHLVLENDDNSADLLVREDGHRPQFYTAQWDDDIHHALHVLATGETSGYYADYTKHGSDYSPIQHLGRCLTQGFTYQGQPAKGRDGELKGQPSTHLPPTAFISFIQNHDQIGNRAFGDRIASITSVEGLKAISAAYLLSPLIPMIYMGEEWGTKTPFFYFCDVGDELAPLVTAGRRKEFAKFPEFSKPETREQIPDPCVIETFQKSKLDWSEFTSGTCAEILSHYKNLIALRSSHIVPLLKDWTGAGFEATGESGIYAHWQFGQDKKLVLIANFSDKPLDTGSLSKDCRAVIQNLKEDQVIYKSGKLSSSILSPWSVLWLKS